MVVLASALLAGLALQQAVASGEPAEPYRCSVPVALEGFTAGMWRDFEPARPDDFYIIQLNDPQPGGGPRAIWRIDNRPPARPRDYGWQTGRPEAVVFAQGPDSVSFGSIATGEIRDGPLWVHLYGDGVHAGTYLHRTARETRRAARREVPGVSIYASQAAAAEAMARLRTARQWTAVLVDGSGRELGRRTITMPLATEVQAEFERARGELLRNRQAFLAHPTEEEDAPCAYLPPPEATI